MSTSNRTKRSVFGQSRMRKTQYGGASRTILSSSSKKNVQIGAGSERLGGPAKPPVQVFDDQGQDVTPLPLLQLDPNVVRKNQSNILADSSAGTPTDLMSQASIYQTGTVTASTFGGGPFTRSVFSASQSGRSTGSITEDHLVEPSTDLSAWAEIKHKHEEVKEELTEEDLDKIVDLQLTETETIWLLDMPGVFVQQDSDESQSVKEQNLRYHELVKSRVGNDRYAERGMNTFNEPPKLKAVQTTKIGSADIGVMATTWDMHDTYQLVAELEAKAKEKAEQEGEEATDVGSRTVSVAQLQQEEKTETESGKEAGTPVTREGTQVSQSSKARLDQDTRVNRSVFVSVFEESRATMSSMAGTDSVFNSKESTMSRVPDQEDTQKEDILQSEGMRRKLVIMERAVNLNTYQAKQASYRGLPIVQDIDKVVDEDDKSAQMSVSEMGPNLDRLWAYQCPLTKGRNVSCISWNKINPDLLAVGYGQFEFTNQKGGLICCWSLKNPEFPERIYTCPSGVTSMDFSLAHPNLLAVGLYDGTVAIYNVRSTSNETVLDSLKDIRADDQYDSGGKHTGPVWQLRWIEKERGSGEERAEVLVSISQDGRITQWSIRKGFESYDLMKLKRVPSKQGKVKKSEAFISRFAGGLCFDFSAKDSNIYLAGTEEGHIHRCSCSYNEQYLDSYIDHQGPVYAIQWSPFVPDVFLSCCGDWTVKLWHQDRLKPVLSFHSSTKAIPSVCWSPRSATVFGCCTEGAIEVWDLSQSTLDPIITNKPMAGVKLSTVTFARNSNCILVGDSEGQVSVYQLRGMPEQTDDKTETLNKTIQSSLASQLQKQ